MNRSLVLSIGIFLLVLAGGAWFLLDNRFETLVPDRVVVRSSPGRGRHCYQFWMEKGQFAWLELAQRQADMEMYLYSPGGRRILQRDSMQEGMGMEAMGFIAESTGSYRLKVSAFDPKAAGGYELHLYPPRVPDARDHARAEASSRFYEAQNLLASHLKAYQAEASGYFVEAQQAWAAAGEPLQEIISLWHQALLLEKAGDRPGQAELLARVVARLEGLQEPDLLALALHGLGTAEIRQNSDAAIFFYNCALHIRQAPDLFRAETLQALAMAYRIQGSYGDTFALLLQAKDIQEVYGTPNSWAEFYDHWGKVCSLDKKPAEAVAAFEQALTNLGKRPSNLRIGILSRLSDAYTALEQYPEALDYVLQALDLVTDSEDFLRPALWYQCGVARFHLGEFQGALDNLRAAAARFELVDSGDELLSTLQFCARVELKMDLREQALADIERAFSNLERSQQNTRSQSRSIKYTAIRYETLELLVELVLGEKNLSEQQVQRVLMRLDRFRDFSLVMALQYPDLVPRNRLAQNPKIAEIHERINKWRLQLDYDQHIDQNNKATLNRQIEEALRYYDLLLTEQQQSQETDPVIPEGLNLAGMQHLLSDQDLVLFYAMGETKVYLLALDRERLQSFDLGPRIEIEADIREFSNRVKSSQPMDQQATLVSTGRRLAKLLPTELVGSSDARRLIILPDGYLHYLPFAALPQAAEGPLVGESHEIVYLPSLAALGALRERPRSHGHADRITPTVVADPVLTGTGLQPLVFARREANLIKKTDPSARLLLGTDASKASILGGSLANAPVIHFACHGILTPDRYEHSALILSSRDEQGRLCDYFLNVTDIETLSLSASLVVLSACETGLGEPIRGAGLVGLPQAFLRAGAQAVVVSLWNVDDEATMVLMQHFYHHLVELRQGPSEALQAAQSALRATDKWSAPYYWAGFRLFGDWKIRQTEKPMNKPP